MVSRRTEPSLRHFPGSRPDRGTGPSHGYNRLPVRYPQARLAPNNKPEARAALPLLRRLLVARGYREAITFSFIDPALFELFDPATSR